MKKGYLLIALCFIASIFSCKTAKVEPTPLELLKRGEKDLAKDKFLLPHDINATDTDGNTVLHLAAEIDDDALIAYFVTKGANTELKNKKGDTPLHVAINNDSFKAAKSLAIMGVGENLFARNGDGITALDLGLQKNRKYYDIFITTKAGEIRDDLGRSIVHYFVQTENIDGIRTCIEKGIPISIKDKDGKTPLDFAFEKIDNIKLVEIAATLIEGGAEEIKTDFAYFQTAVSVRNMNERFVDGQTPLHLASIFGHSAIAQYLLENNALTDVQDSAGSTPLHEAVRYGNIEIAKMILNSGANINAKDNLGKTPIMLIMPKDKIDELYKLLIQHKADLNHKDMYGDTVLHTAAMMHVNTNIIESLTKNGADINARNKEGVTPLAIAIMQQDIETVKLFTKHGAIIHTKDTLGRSPLTLALKSGGELFEATVNKLNISSQDSEGNTPLHVALINDAPLTKIQYIISLTDDVNIRNRDGNSALFIAIMKNRKQVGDMLLAKEADIFSTNTNNNSPLRVALKYGGTIQEWMITSKTINSTDGSGNSVLHYATEWKFKEAITFLLDKGANIHAKNANGETPLFSAAKTDDTEVIQLIVDGGASLFVRDNLGSTPLHTAVRWDAINSVEKLLELGIEINSQNSAGKSALTEAVLSGKKEICEYLLDCGANPNASDTNGVTILMDAIRTANTEIVQLLLDNNANPNLQEINGRNSYHEAAFMGQKDIIDLIRNAGGNPLARDKQGKTPFSIVLNNNKNIIKAVLGDKRNITDSDGNSPIHIIVKNNADDELLKMLIDEGYPIDTRNSDGYTPLNYAIEADDIHTALILMENNANPFQTIDKKGTNGVTIALEKNSKQMIANIVKYARDMTDIQGNTILHYAAKTSSQEIVQTLLSYGLDTNVKNVSGDTPYTIAVRWRRNDIAPLLAPKDSDSK